MYFTKIRLNGLTVIDLPMVNAKPYDQYILKGGSGLGPTEVDVSIKNTLNAGGFYQGRRPQTKEVVLHIGLNPTFKSNQTAADLRQSLYGLLTPGNYNAIKVELYNDTTLLMYVTGYVSKLEIAPFSKTPEVQATFECLEQYFLAPAPLYVDPGSKSAPKIVNMGTAETGFHMDVIFTADLAYWQLSHLDLFMRVNYPFLSGDKLSIETRPGIRAITVTRGGTTTNIIYALSSQSRWLWLHGGDNVFETSSPAFNWGDVYYLPQYWGI